jgi:hypothetical protein
MIQQPAWRYEKYTWDYITTETINIQYVKLQKKHLIKYCRDIKRCQNVEHEKNVVKKLRSHLFYER